MKVNSLYLRIAAKTRTHFLQSTTLHGFKYFMDRHVAERVLWLIVHSVNACCACVLCAVLWRRYVENPSILAVQPPPGGPRAVPEPFPALTVCPPYRISRDAAARFTRKLSVAPGLEMSYLVSIMPQLSALFAPASIFRRQRDLFVLDLLLSKNNLTYREALEQLAPTCDELMIRCSLRGEPMPCGMLFRRVVARSGICCGFNRPILPTGYQEAESIRSMAKWSIDDDSGMDPMIAATTGLSVMINTSEYLVVNPSIDFVKFKMEEITMNSLKSDYFLMTPGREYWAGLVRVRIEENNGSDEMADMNCDPRRGKSPYKRFACLMECIARVMLTRCGCVGPTYPLAPGTKPCIPSRIPCLIAIDDDTLMRDGSCDCQPPCEQSRVFTEVDSMPLSALEISVDPFYHGVQNQTVVLRTYLASNHRRLYSLEPIVSYLTLLSSVGGVFNVFLGLSVVSILEVLFFVAVRLPLKIIRGRRTRNTNRTVGFTTFQEKE